VHLHSLQSRGRRGLILFASSHVCSLLSRPSLPLSLLNTHLSLFRNHTPALAQVDLVARSDPGNSDREATKPLVPIDNVLVAELVTSWVTFAIIAYYCLVLAMARCGRIGSGHWSLAPLPSIAGMLFLPLLKNAFRLLTCDTLAVDGNTWGFRSQLYPESECYPLGSGSSASRGGIISGYVIFIPELIYFLPTAIELAPAWQHIRPVQLDFVYTPFYLVCNSIFLCDGGENSKQIARVVCADGAAVPKGCVAFHATDTARRRAQRRDWCESDSDTARTCTVLHAFSTVQHCTVESSVGCRAHSTDRRGCGTSCRSGWSSGGSRFVVCGGGGYCHRRFAPQFLADVSCSRLP
jgi:hypothetical protein